MSSLDLSRSSSYTPSNEMPPNQTEIPDRIQVETADELNWDDTADVLVVGLGAAGASASLEARAEGATVIAVDRFFGGGATAISGGIVYAGGGTHIQQEAGVEDTVEETFKGTLSPVKTSYPVDPYFLYLSGNESFTPYSEHAKPAPRGHRTVGGAFPGANLANPLLESCEKAGIDIRFQTRVSRLVVDASGRVPAATLKKTLAEYDAYARPREVCMRLSLRHVESRL